MKSFTERNPTIIGILTIALIAAGTGAALLLNGGFFKDRYTVKAVFVDTAGLRTGDKVRVAGINSGEVTGLEARGNEVLVTMAVDDGVELPRDTRADVVVETLLGNKYVRLVAGEDWDHPLTADTVIRETSTPTEVLDLQNIGTPLLEDLDGDALNDLLTKIDGISKGQKENVGEIIGGLDALATAVNDREAEARSLIDATAVVTGTLSERDEDLLAAVDDLNVLVAGLSERRVELATLLEQTAATAKGTADLIDETTPGLDVVLDELHVDLQIVGRRQVELAATLSGLSNAIEGFASVGYSGPDEFPNTWANMYAQLIGPIGPDAVFGSCGLLDDAFDVLLGPDPIAACQDRTGPLPGAGPALPPGTPADAPATGTPAPTGPADPSNPLTVLYGPLTEAAG